MNTIKLKLAFFILCIGLITAGCNNKPEIKPDPGASFNIAPNPAKDVAYVYGNNSGNQPYLLQVFDTKGNKIAEQNFGNGTLNYTIPLSDKPKGNYQVILKTPSAVFTKKLVKI